MTVSKQEVEHVLVVPTELFHEIGHFQGICTDPEPYLKSLLDPLNTSYRPRDEVEEDPSFKQLIPYCIFQHDGKIFNYQRGKSSGEGRLHAKKSIGIGGHISSEDHSENGSPYIDGMKREIEEEVNLDSKYTVKCIGMINDDENEVGKVHLGIVHLFELEEAKVSPREESIQNTGFISPEELMSDKDSFETWSQICIQHLFK